MSLAKMLAARAAAAEVRSSVASAATELAARLAAPAPGPLPDPAPASSGPLGPAASRLLAAAVRKDPAGWADIRRIVGLPTHYEVTEEEVDAFCRENVLASAYEQGFRLFPKQVEALLQYDAVGSPFCPIGVGWGKTLLALMIANRAWRRPEIRGRANNRRILLVCYTGAYEQLVGHDIGWARTKVPIQVPFYSLGRKRPQERLAYAKSLRSGCYVIPMSHVSDRSFSEFIAALKPDTVILDEAHQCSNPTAARTKRIRGYCEESNCDFVPLSGTMTRKSIRDYHHLLKASRGDQMPLPKSSMLAAEWGQVLDSGAGDPSDAATGPIKPLVEWARRKFPREDFSFSTDGIRHAYMRRLCTAPGVVSSGDADLGVSLILATKEIPQETCEAAPGWAKLTSLIADVQEAWLTPNGDEIEHAIHTWKWMFELSAGFYNELTWPEPDVYAERRGISTGEAVKALEAAKFYHSGHQEYSKVLRSWLESRARPGLDTPFLVGKDMHSHGPKNVTPDLYEAWQTWKARDFEGRPERDSRAVRICPYKVHAAVRWAAALESGGGIVWAYHEDVCRWAFEELRAAGADPLLCLAGDAGNRAILDPANAGRLIVASIAAHGTAKNLQAWSRNFLIQTPRPPAMAEQLLGRTHRNGQAADEVRVDMVHTLEFDHLNFAACITDAVYIHTTTDNRQKLVYAQYEAPMPKIFPASALRARGFDNALLNARQQALVTEKFENVARPEGGGA